jgi:hypothetical protein
MGWLKEERINTYRKKEGRRIFHIKGARDRGRLQKEILKVHIECSRRRGR